MPIINCTIDRRSINKWTKLQRELGKKVMKAVNQSYAIPEFLSKIGFNRKQFMVSAALQAGSTNKQIARQLGIKEATVKYHLTKMN
tara:strand:+ start:191 stop:448 length:258 start_codon:yes stop_codon:yes gene_type:complete